MRFTTRLALCLPLLLAACERKPGSGARVAEAEEGPWTWVCAVRLTGPPREEKRARGEGSHIQKGQARRLAIAAACTEAGGGAPCTAQTADWHIQNERCTTTERRDARALHECTLEVVRAPGPRDYAGQAEAETAAKACDRAIREGCRALNGGDECVAGQEDWRAGTTLARVRPAQD